MSDQRRIRCPVCGAEMNRHAEKVDYSWTLEEPAAAEQDELKQLLDSYRVPAPAAFVEASRSGPKRTR